MKKLLYILCVLLLGIGMVRVAHATLFDRGGGLIYDSDQNITWLQDANYAKTSGYVDDVHDVSYDGRMFWSDAVAWADQLEYQGYNDWRLPTTVNGPETTMAGYNITSSEMGYMYYVNLGNLGRYDTDGCEQTGWDLLNTGPFTNLETHGYWSGTPTPLEAWFFSFYDGSQFVGCKEAFYHYAWAVRPGDSAPVPEPSTILLLGIGLLGLIGIKSRKKKS